MRPTAQFMLLIITLSLLTFCCDKSLDQLEIEDIINAKAGGIAWNGNSDLKGVWVNTLNIRDTLIITDTIVNRWDPLADSFWHYYRYSIQNDTIILDYRGRYKILTPAFYRKFQLNKALDSLIIHDFHTAYPGYEGDQFIKIPNE